MPDRRHQPGYGITNEEVLPGAHPVTVGLTDFFREGRNLVVQVQFERGPNKMSRNFGITVTQTGDGIQCVVSWKKIRGWLDHDCNLRKEGANTWVTKLEAAFADRVATYVASLQQ